MPEPTIPARPAPFACRTPSPIRSRCLALLASAGLAVVALGAPGPVLAQSGEGELVSVGQGEAVQRINLGVDKSLVIDLPRDAFDILVANPAIADAVTRSSRRIYLFGRQVGETNIFVFDENGAPIANIDLQVERDVSSLEADLERFVPGSDIQVELVNNNVVLSGVVLTPQDAERAERLATAFLTAGAAEGAEILNLLEIVGEDQVTLKLMVAEVQRTVAKSLGVSLSGSLTTATLGDGVGNFGDLQGSGTVSGNSQAGVIGAAAGASVGNFSAQLQATLRALTTNNAIRTLAEPVLTAISGQEAQFRVGGAIAFPSIEFVDGQTISTFEEVEFGVEMSFTPVVLSSGRISITLNTNVSEPVAAGGDLNNTVYTLRERTASTTVEVPSGGSFMIAGLLSDSVRQSVSQVPGLSGLPVLGALFRSREYQREETELVIVATPYLVRPVPTNALALPTDNLHPANDSKAFFLGRINRIYGNRKVPDAPFHGNVGFVYK